MDTISFARGVPSPDCLPVEELADCARAVLERDGRTILNYGPVSGYQPLREWIADRHGVEADRVFVTNGSLQGFVLLASHLLSARPGRVLVEAPSYDRPLKILARLEAEIVAIPLDKDGLDLDLLERELQAATAPSFLYVIPTFQNPSGRTLSTERRHRLVELAHEHDLFVVEDDPYALVRFEGESPPTLFELDGGTHVLYTSSFSKIVSPGIRVGYLLLPPDVEEAIEAAAVQTYLTPALVAEGTVYEFLRRGLLEPNLERVRGLLRTRRDAMLAALERELAAGASWNRPEGGYFLWLDLPEGVSSADLLARASEAGVTFVPGSDFFPNGAGGEHSARLAYSFVSPEQIDAGVARLGSLTPAPARS